MAAFFIFLVILLGVIEFLSIRESFVRLRYKVSVSSHSVDPGEHFKITSTIENASRIPVAFLRVQENFPGNMDVYLPDKNRYRYTKPLENDKSNAKLLSTVYLMPHQRLERSVEVSLPTRGRYFLRGAEISGGDFLGLTENPHPYHAFSEIVVMPSPAPSAPELIALGGFLGDISVRRFTMEDPVLTLGFREYTGREPMKQISWPQTLSAGMLMVKEYDHTLETAVTVMLNVEAPGAHTTAIERCFSLARTVCETLESRHIKYGFITNATAAGAIGEWSAVSEGLGRSHLYAILEGLGRATYIPSEPFARTVDKAIRKAERGRCHIVISPVNNESVMAYNAKLRATIGGEVTIIIPDVSDDAEEVTC